jgi:hypothetical protein
VFQAENPEPLVSGVVYNTSSFASFRLIVTDVNEAPVFSQHIFQEKVSEDTAVGTKVGNVTARDPEGLGVRYRRARLGRPRHVLRPQPEGLRRNWSTLANGLLLANRVASNLRQGLWPSVQAGVSDKWEAVSGSFQPICCRSQLRTGELCSRIQFLETGHDRATACVLDSHVV